MSEVMEEEIKRWTARLKSALVLEIIQGKITVAAASRQLDLTPAEIESLVEDGKRGMENALRAKPEDVREHTSASSKTFRKPTARPCWRSAPERSWRPCWEGARADALGPAGSEGRRSSSTDDQAVPVVRRGAADNTSRPVRLQRSKRSLPSRSRR